jgi:ATP-dependent helicase HrpA
MTPWAILKEYPRYLQSIAVRLDKLKTTGSAKDLATEESANRFWVDYRKRIELQQPSAASWQNVRSKGSSALGIDYLYPTGKLLEYRWSIEELRVSLHSQQLGTRISISAKRLEKLQQELDLR